MYFLLKIVAVLLTLELTIVFAQLSASHGNWHTDSGVDHNRRSAERSSRRSYRNNDPNLIYDDANQVNHLPSGEAQRGEEEAETVGPSIPGPHADSSGLTEVPDEHALYTPEHTQAGDEATSPPCPAAASTACDESGMLNNIDSEIPDVSSSHQDFYSIDTLQSEDETGYDQHISENHQYDVLEDDDLMDSIILVSLSKKKTTVGREISAGDYSSSNILTQEREDWVIIDIEDEDNESSDFGLDDGIDENNPLGTDDDLQSCSDLNNDRRKKRCLHHKRHSVEEQGDEADYHELYTDEENEYSNPVMSTGRGRRWTGRRLLGVNRDVYDYYDDSYSIDEEDGELYEEYSVDEDEGTTVTESDDDSKPYLIPYIMDQDDSGDGDDELAQDNFDYDYDYENDDFSPSNQLSGEEETASGGILKRYKRYSSDQEFISALTGIIQQMVHEHDLEKQVQFQKEYATRDNVSADSDDGAFTDDVLEEISELDNLRSAIQVTPGGPIQESDDFDDGNDVHEDLFDDEFSDDDLYEDDEELDDITLYQDDVYDNDSYGDVLYEDELYDNDVYNDNKDELSHSSNRQIGSSLDDSGEFHEFAYIDDVYDDYINGHEDEETSHRLQRDVGESEDQPVGMSMPPRHAHRCDRCHRRSEPRYASRRARSELHHANQQLQSEPRHGPMTPPQLPPMHQANQRLQSETRHGPNRPRRSRGALSEHEFSMTLEAVIENLIHERDEEMRLDYEETRRQTTQAPETVPETVTTSQVIGTSNGYPSTSSVPSSAEPDTTTVGSDLEGSTESLVHAPEDDLTGISTTYDSDTKLNDTGNTTPSAINDTTTQTDVVTTPSWLTDVIEEMSKAVEGNVLSYLMKRIPGLLSLEEPAPGLLSLEEPAPGLLSLEEPAPGLLSLEEPAQAAQPTDEEEHAGHLNLHEPTIPTHLVPPPPPIPGNQGHGEEVYLTETTVSQSTCIFPTRLHQYTVYTAIAEERSSVVSLGAMAMPYKLVYLNEDDQGYNEVQALQIKFNTHVTLTRIVVPSYLSLPHPTSVRSNVAMFWLKVVGEDGHWDWIHNADGSEKEYSIVPGSSSRQSVYFNPPIDVSQLRLYPQAWTGASSPSIQLRFIGCSH